ncbi:HNH endonuclease [Marinifilum sp. N1E240]|uniref:HNH endonuclease domain-containing protein n=1 Tax=Marinifilum sp. N1E240 TaxID=2608082 RepID=UPI00128B4B03|nr:HNH endonuclease domain-containing protein [Marinifilum sp. N1E240]MPQ46586.1 HNH endonuclease [Marinifilum sp. N1E240]
MIKLDLTNIPNKLTKKLQDELTEEYKKNGTAVWNRKFIREAVLGFSHGKCCYSECKLNEESKYMEVDHFLPKNHFPDDVLSWGNLLPSSKKSNTTKGDLNTQTTTIINPLFDDPKEHLYIQNYRFYDKDEIGRRTIDYTALNDRRHFVNKRYEIGTHVVEILEDICINLQKLKNDVTLNHPELTRLLGRFINLLNEATRTEEYSATLSTVILTDCCSKKIIETFKEIDFWDNEIDNLIKELEFCSLIE